MKNNNFINRIFYLIAFVIMSLSNCLAQDPDPLDPGTDPGAPIDSPIMITLSVLAILLVMFFYLKKMNQKIA